MSILQMFSYPFMQRALIAGILVSLCAALLGVSLVLKRYSMIGDGLSHVSFGALAIAVALGVTPLWFSIPVVTLAAFLLLRPMCSTVLACCRAARRSWVTMTMAICSFSLR